MDAALRAASAILQAVMRDSGAGGHASRLGLALGVADANEGIEVSVRLASLARSGTALVSEAMYRRAVDRFDFCGLTPVVERSDPLPGPVFELVGPKPVRSGTHHEGPERVPIAGRERALDVLDECLAAVERGQSAVLHVIGEPGVGKSKLLREWLARAETRARTDRWVTLRAHGVSCGISPLQAWVRLVAPICSEVGERSGIQSPSLHQVRRSLAARGAPALILVDDVHWADVPSTERLWQLLTDPGVPSLVILAYRPPFVSRAVWRPTHRRLALAGLGEDAMRQLVERLVQNTTVELSPGTREDIVANARGNPLYAEESVEYLGALPAAGTAQRGPLPASLAELLACRIRSTIDGTLPELERRCRDHGFGLWPFALSVSRERVLADLDELEERLASWLDRFDVIEGERDRLVHEFLDGLARIDGQLALLSLYLGRQRPHRHRLAQALARLGERSGTREGW